MKINISIDGVLRDTVSKAVRSFENNYLNDVVIKENENFIDDYGNVVNEINDEFKYEIKIPIKNDELYNSLIFQNREEFDFFYHNEFALEISSNSEKSYPSIIMDMYKLMKKNHLRVIGLNETLRQKNGTLLFLGKNVTPFNELLFINEKEIIKQWNKCDLWVTDDKRILDLKPENKKCYLFETDFNQHIKYDNKIKSLKDIKYVRI
jgi:hypothetical protein